MASGEFLRPPAEGPSPGEGLRGETGGEAGGGGKREGDSELVVFCKVDQRFKR